jgi:hypothetical protein
MTTSTRLWQHCDGPRQIQPLQCRAHRVVESQQVIATLALVDTLAEQDLLEQLLDTAKPARPQAHRHYLLTTPFRYPPLIHGSRFGQHHEPSLFYAATTLPTALAETAYYRLVFLAGLSQPFAQPLNTEHTAFFVHVASDSAVLLQTPPFDEHCELLMSRTDYTITQQLGGDMRTAGITAFQYRSARDPEGGINIGLFVPQVIRSNAPQSPSRWLCQSTPDGIAFRAVDEHASVRFFARECFLVDGRLPAPAL